MDQNNAGTYTGTDKEANLPTGIFSDYYQFNDHYDYPVWDYPVWDYPVWETTPICLCLSLQIIILNAFVIRHYRLQDGCVALMYLLLASTDTIVAVGTFLYHFALVLYYLDQFSWWTYYRIWVVTLYPSFSFFYPFSVFINVIIGVSRTIKIVRPFFHIRKKKVLLACLIFCLVLVPVVCGELYILFSVPNWVYVLKSGDIPLDTPILGAFIVIELSGYTIVTPRMDITPVVACMTILFVIPGLVVMVTCVIQIVALYRARRAVPSAKGAVPNQQHHVTLTILLISAVFVICNTTYTIWMLLYVLFDFAYNRKWDTQTSVTSVTSVLKHAHVHYMLTNRTAIRTTSEMLYWGDIVLGQALPLLNAALNPVILIARNAELKNGIWGQFRV